MKVTIITPTFNSEKFLGRTIESLKNLNYNSKLIEVIFIDNGSSDKTIDIIRNANIKYRIVPGVPVSKLRNIGASLASGNIFAFVDSDCLVFDDWLSIAINKLQKNPSVGALGCYYGLGDNPTWVEKTWYHLKKDISGEVSFLSAGNLFVPAAVFAEINGFDEKLITGEDWELCQRIKAKGYKVINDPELSVAHLGNVKTLMGIVKKERWYGLGMIGALKLCSMTKPLVATIFFMILSVVALVALLTGSNRITLFSISLIGLLLMTISVYLTKTVLNHRLKLLIQCIPIAFCYLLGRSLSLIDLIWLSWLRSK